MIQGGCSVHDLYFELYQKFLTEHYNNLQIYDTILLINSFVLLSCCLAYTEGGVSSRFQISPKQEIDSMVSPEAKQEMTVWPSECMIEKPAKKLKHVSSYHKSDAMNIVREMPCVITAGDDTTGKRIEGLLYKYKRGQVCIVCVCHGCFLSPTEFVMHAGGKEVTDPMKHITVSSDSFYINGDGTAFITHPF